MPLGDDSGMENPSHRRDRAAARVRRLTAWALAGAGVLTAGFAGLAAGSTHAKKTVTTGGVKAATKTTQRTVTAPTPTLQSNGSTAAPQQQSQTQQQTQTPVTQSTAPPVVVSGGS
jgi:hypothetical protein